MSLQTNSRVCGSVHVVELSGRMVAGAEITLQAALRQDWCRNIHQVVLLMHEVKGLDSMGLGMIVRQASSLRQRGGDMRLAGVPPAIMNVLELTRMHTVVKVFPSEQDAVLSFLEKAAAAQCAHCPAGSVLLVDQSPDFCAFAHALLTQHGYDVKLASLVRDARILLTVQKFDVVLAGPSTRVEMLDSTLATFRSLAPKARVLAVAPALATEEPHLAGQALLAMLGAKAQA